MYRFLLSIILFVCLGAVHGQSFFDILPDVGGVGGQAMCFIAVPDTNNLRIIGHRYDTIVPGLNTQPWLGDLNYSGDLIEVIPLIDSKDTSSFYVFNNTLAHKQDDIYYHYSLRDVGEQYTIPYLIELDLSTGHINRSKLIRSENYPNYGYLGKFVDYRKDKQVIMLLNSLYKDDSVKTIIIILDTLFTEKKVIEVEENMKDTYTYWGKINHDKTITFLGFGLVSKSHERHHVFLKKIDSLGNILEYNLAPTDRPMNFGIANARTVLEGENGNWVVAGLYYDDKSDICFDCGQHIPYIFSASAHFDSLLWQTRFYDLPDQNHTAYFLKSITQVSDGYVVAGDHLSSDESPFPPSGMLFKASLDGDSLWMKHFIPLDWDEERVAWVNFNDIKTTPDGNIIVVGAIGDLDLQIVRPWILHLDKDGCLVPGCNTVSTNEQYSDAFQEDNFIVYPNPATTEIYFLSKITSSESISIRLVTNKGIILKGRDFTPIAGSQYIFPVDDLASGVYHLILTNARTNQNESHTFIRQ